jgi:hypothetical protein
MFACLASDVLIFDRLAVGLHGCAGESAPMITNAGVALRSWMVRRSAMDMARDVMAVSLPSFARSFGDPAESVGPESERSSCDMAVEDGVVQAYNEEAFRYFLEIERKRSEGASRPLLLLLVDVKGERGGDSPIDGVTATQLFSGLSASLRETDFVGWYRQQRVVGAVLTQRASSHRSDMVSAISDHVFRRLSSHLPLALVNRIQLRVFHLPGRVEDERQN